jgi:hypothetical protein
MDIKFIIVKDKIKNRLRHFKSDINDHYVIAKNNGYDVKDLIETGMIIDKNKFYVLECYNPLHRQKANFSKKFILNDVNKYLDELTTYRLIKARECRSRYSYGNLKEGD